MGVPPTLAGCAEKQLDAVYRGEGEELEQGLTGLVRDRVIADWLCGMSGRVPFRAGVRLRPGRMR